MNLSCLSCARLDMKIDSACETPSSILTLGCNLINYMLESTKGPSPHDFVTKFSSRDDNALTALILLSFGLRIKAILRTILRIKDILCIILRTITHECNLTHHLTHRSNLQSYASSCASSCIFCCYLASYHLIMLLSS